MEADSRAMRLLCSKNKDKKSESNSQLVTVCHVWMYSVPEKVSSGTEYACRAQKGFLGYATRFQKPSVLKTGFWGTEGIFGTRNPLLWYGTSQGQNPEKRLTTCRNIMNCRQKC